MADDDLSAPIDPGSDASQFVFPPPEWGFGQPAGPGDAPPATATATGGDTPGLSPAEASQIQIDQPPQAALPDVAPTATLGYPHPPGAAPLTPDEESQIDIDQPAAPPTPMPGGEMHAPIALPDWQATAQGLPSPVAQSLDHIADPHLEGTLADEHQHQALATYEQAATPEEKTRAWDALSPDQKRTALESENKTYAAMSPEDQARTDYLREDTRQKTFDAKLNQAATWKSDQAMANLAKRSQALNVVRQKRAVLEQQLTAAATKPVETTFGWGQTIAGAVAAAIGGLAQPFTGHNAGLEIFERGLDRHIAQQNEDKRTKMNSIGEQLRGVAEQQQDVNEDFQTDDAKRVIGYEQLIQGAQQEANKFDPAGTTVSKYNQFIQGARARQAMVKDQLDQRNYKNYLDGLKASGGYDKDEAEAAKSRIEAAEKAAKLGAGPGPAIYGKVYGDLNAVPPKDVDKAFPLPSINGRPGGYAIAASPTDKADATHLTEMYEQANYDINELTKISQERNGAKTTGGAIWAKWQSTNEQHYQQLLIDVANVYGMMIHGRAPTAGVLEEVLDKSAPELKAAWQAGDTTALLNKFHDDIDNRTSLRLQTYLGSSYQVRSQRPHIETPNANTLGAPLTERAVKGNNGFARFDVGNASQALDAIFKEHIDQPGIGGTKDYNATLNDIEVAQRKAAGEITARVDVLSKIKNPNAKQQDELRQNRLALKDRQEMVRTIGDYRKKNVEQGRKETEGAKFKQDVKDERQTYVNPSPY